MTVGTFFIRIWRIVSIIGLILSLVSSYISYPADVAVRFDETNVATAMVDREVLFYAAVGAFLLNNVFINTIARLFPRLPTEKIPVPNQVVWAANRPKLNEIMGNWFYALQASVNTILALGLLVLSFLNRSTPEATDAQNYIWLLPMCTLIIASVVISLPIRLLMKPGVDND